MQKYIFWSKQNKILDWHAFDTTASQSLLLGGTRIWQYSNLHALNKVYLRLRLCGIIPECNRVPWDVVETFLTEGISVGEKAQCL